LIEVFPVRVAVIFCLLEFADFISCPLVEIG